MSLSGPPIASRMFCGSPCCNERSVSACANRLQRLQGAGDGTEDSAAFTSGLDGGDGLGDSDCESDEGDAVSC